ncbi:hypothetical protein L207DRAFT_558398 [Hyaloscypha variabilis F]|uniref:Uncharacterized protein n=1 Tax=Hyaloscypha variabilis (strain UAMH 11265 / GT02V1 / F) TaxID=1149755 RepID=A0A2J6R0N6_HYAVF|nr:hypothetical protein L207DRAFT_558398 [Hyaloscypha variabilis F]
MASVEALSLTTTTALAYISAFLLLLPLRDLFVESFSGQGSYLRITAKLFALGNLKNCLESDYNLHKSNVTYFFDLDVTRLQMVCMLLEPGIVALRNNNRHKIGAWSIVLGGVMCTFKREIGMYRGYEMWSRVLCWDRKWIYIAEHFGEKGAGGYRSVKRRQGEREAKVDEKAILASAISKYVVKLGRLTIHLNLSLNASGLLPPKPGDGWDWKRILAENKKGLKHAEHFAALDGLHGEFTGSQ